MAITSGEGNMQELRNKESDLSTTPRSKRRGVIPSQFVKEIAETEIFLFVAQWEGFNKEIRQLRTRGCVERSSPLYSSYPIWDPVDSLIRLVS